MGLISRNVAIVMAVLVAVQVAHAVPVNKDGDSKGGKGGKNKGRRSVAEEAEEGGVSSLEGSLADALAEDAEDALVLEEEVRARRAVAAEEESPEEQAAALEDDASADGLSQFVKKKPCKGNKGGKGSGGDPDTETVGDGEAGDLQGQKQGKNRRKKTQRENATEPAALANWMTGDADDALW